VDNMRKMNDVVLEKKQAEIAAKAAELTAQSEKNKVACSLRAQLINETAVSGGKPLSEAALERMVKDAAEYVAADDKCTAARIAALHATAEYEHSEREFRIMEAAGVGSK